MALVCSGDPGIYALATLVLELLDREPRPEWQRVELVVSPGVSALQAAAARLGAPLGHDFCAISLSDLLTPWSVIERRLEAAAAADFVLALYNPASQRRREGLVRAHDILLRHRPPGTPVIVARNLGREDEAVRLTSLEAFEPASVDMLSLVLVGASTSRRVPRLHGGDLVYTPRGYPVGVSPARAALPLPARETRVEFEGLNAEYPHVAHPRVIGIEHKVAILGNDGGRGDQRELVRSLEPSVTRPLVPAPSLIAGRVGIGGMSSRLITSMPASSGTSRHTRAKLSGRLTRSDGPKCTKVSSTQVETFRLV